MRATLQFTLPEEQEEFLRAQKGIDYHSALCDLAEELRRRAKYDAPAPESWQEVRELFFAIVDVEL